MKRLLLIVLFISITFSIFSMPARDIVVVSSLGDERNEWVLDKFHEKYPDSSVEFLFPSMNDGSTVTMDARIKAGEPMHVYADYLGRVSKYMTPDLALNFNDYITDQADFCDGMLDPLTADGKLLGLPFTGGAFALSVNLDMLEEIGYADFDFEDWTLDDFYMLGDAVKATYGTEKNTTMIFFQNQSGDYVWMNWLSAFGAEMYHAGDYSKTVFKSSGGVQMFEFFKHLVDNGYTRKDSAILNDDDFLAALGEGTILFGNAVPGWVSAYQDTAIKQGLRTEVYPYKFVEFPRVPGVEKVPASGSSSGITAFKNDDKAIEEQSAYIAWLYTMPEMQRTAIEESGNYAVRKNLPYVFDSPYWVQIAKIVSDNGMLDLGLSQQWYSDVRIQCFPLAQAVVTGKMTPTDAAAAYEKAVNEILQK